jgi:hypothetical protein
MPDKFQRAVQRVKDGDRAGAQQLLAEILTSEPDHEQAWLWLAAILNEAQRQYCIRQVLRINPNNRQARRAWEALGLDDRELQLAPTYSTVAAGAGIASQIDVEADHLSPPGSVESAIEPVETAIATVEIARDDAPEAAMNYWVYPARGPANLIVIDEKRLISAVVPSKRRNQAVELLRKDVLPVDLLQDTEEVNFSKITEVTHNKRHVQIRYFENGRNRKSQLSCVDGRMGAAVFNTLARNLGPRFDRRTESVGFNAKIIGTFILFMLLAILTAALFFGAVEVATGNISLPIGSRVIGGIGPLGVLGVGGVLMLITFISMIVQYTRPPKMAKLVLDESM